ncbi:LuxR C-terminal-related transcriptional regulator [Streptomyces massasporeus]|uniref:LuxR C-terminal-related transcriptional regulator n=1 Tax=Streptomyces massasporeus TaxID=67324 RepID=UPI0036AD0219
MALPDASVLGVIETGELVAPRIPVFIDAEDPLSRTGLEAALKSRPEIALVDFQAVDAHTVAVKAADCISDYTLRALNSIGSHGCSKMILITHSLTNDRLPEAIEVGVCAVVRRTEATAPRLAQIITRTAMAPYSLGRTLQLVASYQYGSTVSVDEVATELSGREARILSLIAEGLDTREIAHKLSYSERTIKNVLHSFISRYNLKNRPQAVAYALRQGWI